MTIADDMKQRALAEFDRLVGEREREIRATMKVAGASPLEINAHIEACRGGLAEQRAGIGRMVTVELLEAGVPSLEEANDNVRS
jgi:hypothetical protein